MKKLLSVTMALGLTLCLGGCSGAAPRPKDADPSPGGQPVEIIVFAAASMTETMTQIAQMYEDVAPEVRLVYTFDSSGTLKTQIESGAECDLFISAAQKQMDALGEAVAADTRVDLVENKVVLAVPEGNPAGVTAFEDAAGDKVNLIALGNADVPVGQYSEELYVTLGLWEEIQSKITFGSNVKEVTTWVGENAVDCGVVYGTDAYSAGLEVVATASAELLSSQVLYPAAVLDGSRHPEEAGAFLKYLQGPECAAVFEKVGFSIP